MSLKVDIRKKTGDFTLNVKLECENAVLGLLGASGCGKSMTLRCIAGLEKPDEGIIQLGERIFFDSEKGINISPQKRKIGYLFQELALFPHMTVEENIRCVTDKSDWQKTDELLERFCINDKRHMYPNQLSGGQKQRAALVRMLATEPQLILLDEPFSAMDTYLKWKLENELLELFTDIGKPVIYVSHDRNEIYRLTDKLVVMDNGKSVEAGNVRDVFNAPMTLAAAKLTGCKNFSALKKLDETTYMAEDWGVKLKVLEVPDRNYKYAGYRAHYFEPVDCMSEVNVIECDIIRVIEDTFSVIVTFVNKGCQRNGDLSCLRCEFSKEVFEEFKSRKKMYLRINPQHLMLLES